MCTSFLSCGRLAPSPTGNLHLGNAFSFLVAHAFATHHSLPLILRIEDIDPDRSKPVFEQSIVNDCMWLGLFDGCAGGATLSRQHPAQQITVNDNNKAPSNSFVYDKASVIAQLHSIVANSTLVGWQERMEGGHTIRYMRQSLRTHVYQAVIQQLLQSGLAYPCFCTRKELRSLASAPHIGDEGAPYAGTCRLLTEQERKAHVAAGRRPSIRLNTAAAIAMLNAVDSAHLSPTLQWLEQEYFVDAIQGRVEQGITSSGGDFALQRSDGVVSYQLAVSVDDAAMGVTQVVRGNDLIASTPRQMLLHSLLGYTWPQYFHVPLLVTKAHERLAKRHKSLELIALRNNNITANAIRGYLLWLCKGSTFMQPATPQEFARVLSCLHGVKEVVVPETVEADLAWLSGC